MAKKRDKDLLKQLFIKIRFMLLLSSKSRIKFIKKHHLFGAIGEEVLWQPHILPSDPKLIKIHNNVKVAADVVFINHDVLYDVFNHIDEREFKENLGCIEVMDNCFIGLGAHILPNVKIGPNAIVGACSVVTKDVPEGAVVVGNPAKVVGNFFDVMERQYQISQEIQNDDRFSDEAIQQMWEIFEKEKNLK